MSVCNILDIHEATAGCCYSQEADARERVAAQLEALITSSGWDIAGVATEEEAIQLASRAMTAFVSDLMKSAATRRISGLSGRLKAAAVGRRLP